jgi:hypothetical protein
VVAYISQAVYAVAVGRNRPRHSGFPWDNEYVSSKRLSESAIRCGPRLDVWLLAGAIAHSLDDPKIDFLFFFERKMDDRQGALITRIGADAQDGWS